jgi:hypothetical protein
MGEGSKQLIWIVMFPIVLSGTLYNYFRARSAKTGGRASILFNASWKFRYGVVLTLVDVVRIITLHRN